jgi:putative ABC transport system permease protein
MKLALLELRRRPWRFAPAVIALVLLTVLLLVLGGLLDGLYSGFTGAVRAQPGELLTYSADAKLSVVRSRIDAATTAEVERAPGVDRVGGLGTALLGAKVPGQATETSVALFGYQLAPHGVPAPPSQAGQVYADTSLKAYGVEMGQTLLLGPKRYPVSVVGWVSDTNFLLQGGLWGNIDTWRAVLASARPDLVLAPGTYQVLTVSTAAGVDPARVATAIDGATAGMTRTVTRTVAVDSLPGIKQQRSTFTAIIDTTFVVAGLVVALFFVLLTLERIGMYAVFKAIGASSGQVFSQVVGQAVVIAALSFVLGALLALAVGGVIPPQVPLELTVGRAIEVALGLIVMSILGSTLSLRRVVRIDPATAIG